jgi:hypothetical protein
MEKTQLKTSRVRATTSPWSSGQPSSQVSRVAARSSGLGEAFVLWAIFAVVAGAIAFTYTRTPVRELYHVSVGGPSAGLRAVLGFAGFPAALMALAVLPLVLDRLRRRIVLVGTLVAGSLAATSILPGALGDDAIDARPPNVLAALGLALTFVLTISAARTPNAGRPSRRQPGDRVRLLVAAALLFGALPWIAALLDLSLHGPVLGSLFLTDQLRSQPGVPGLHQAVHAGFHHGLAGVMLALTALLLSRALPYLRRPWPRQALALYLSFLLAYGLGNAVQDFQLEQIVKRGLTSYELPMVLIPALSWAWAVLLAVAAVFYVLAFRPLTRLSADRPSTPTPRQPVAPAGQRAHDYRDGAADESAGDRIRGVVHAHVDPGERDREGER